MIDPYTSVVDLAAAIRAKDVSPVEVAECYLDRIAALDPVFNAFSHRADDEVRAAASAAADAVTRGRPEDLPPLHGVPVPIKDLADVAGWPTTYGSLATDHAPKRASDPVVRRFVDAGAIPLGKTTTSEFGAASFTESDAHGVSRNPWDPDRTPGGSSGGAAIAVAAGMAPIAHAEDGGGSIRVPASCTGLVGLKPTRGRVTSSVVDAEGLGTSGVVSRTVADTAVALDVLARHDPGAWWSPPSPARSFAGLLSEPLLSDRRLSDSLSTDPAHARLRVGVLTTSPIDGIGVDPACVTAVGTVVRALEEAGHHVVDAALPLPPADELLSVFMKIWNVSSAGIPVAHPDRLEPHNRAQRQAALTVDSLAYVESVQAAQRLSRRIVEAFAVSFDLLVTPTMACLPPRVGAWREVGDPVTASHPMAVFTSLFNVTGQPAVSVPIHHDEPSGLPVGVHLVAAPWREDLLLRAAHFLEQVHPWAARRPERCAAGEM
ncbi:amidase [Prauserella rugosa]|uniref:Amidase n=1 Tax=Prauserella rugosa TaxID=43354 RepID=A0A660CJJ4_9PSEU|nr:amidase [Prauserella rugosa]KMS91407.1 hypothetical protein ACZ91_09800 [Streptomyces regensis]TWH22604.1 amidase [Prauserella rugosa]